VPRTDKSVTVLTGMIIAALYVIMLVGVSRESYMRRDAADGANGWRMVDNSAGPCQAGLQICLSGASRRIEPAGVASGPNAAVGGEPAR
jgi:hypothetical protein